MSLQSDVIYYLLSCLSSLTAGDEVSTSYTPAYLRLVDENYAELSGGVKLGQKVYLQNFIEENTRESMLLFI